MNTQTDKRPTSPRRVGASRAKKEKIVAKLSEKVSRAKGFVFTNYQGLTHVQLEKLKKAIKQANAELVVTKNTLLLRSLQISSANWADQISNFEGPTATLFLYGDPIAPLKQLAKTIREFNLPTVKFGIIDKQTLTSEQVLSLAALPPYNVLIAQLLFQMKAPLYRLHRALGWNVQKFVMTLKAIEAKKS
jgi:large subunit ribosomal protein L10